MHEYLHRVKTDVEGRGGGAEAKQGWEGHEELESLAL
jgi:hypothetical protein